MSFESRMDSLFVKTSSTVIWFNVSVPVLSEQIISVLPNVSTAGNFLTNALRLAIFCVPKAKIIVTIAGNPSGMAATAKETDVNNISIQSCPPRNIPTPNITIQMKIIAIDNTLPNLFRFSFNGVLVSSACANILAILPTSVFIPVPVTTPTPRP